MIKTKNLVPSIYYNESRDFQFIGRVYEILINYLKTEVDLIKENPISDNSDSSLLQLLTKTLGFESKHKYVDADLKAICNVFSTLIKNKGSIESIDKTITTLLNVQQINKDFQIVRDRDDAYNLNIYIPVEIQDLILIEDVFNYILPAGFTYNFIFADFAKPITTNMKSIHEIPVKIQLDSNKLGQVTRGFDNENPNDIKPSLMTKEQLEKSKEDGFGLNYLGVVVGGN